MMLKKLLITTIFLIAIFIFTNAGPLATFDTQYPKDIFFYQQFYKIPIGTSRTDIHKLLGEPLIPLTRGGTCEDYSKPKNWLGFSDWTGWILVQLCYNNQDKLEKVTADALFT